MRCIQCGVELGEGAVFCPYCGAAQAAGQTPPQGAYVPPQGTAFAPEASVGGRLVLALASPLFLWACILMTAYSALSVLARSVPVLEILFSVFFWLCYVRAKENVVPANHLKAIHVTAKVSYVLSLVSVGIVAVLGVLLLVFGQSLDFDFFELYSVLPGEFFYFDFLDELISVLGFVLLLVAAGVFCFVWFVMRKMVQCASSVYVSASTCIDRFEHVKFTKTVLFVIGILGAVGALGDLAVSPTLGLAAGAEAAAFLVLGLLLGKYLEQ